MRSLLSLHITFILSFSILFCDTATTDTINVPSDFPTIQQAINASKNGDIISVDPGLYNEDIDFTNKSISIKSKEGASNTIIKGSGTKSVVTFQYNTGSVLDGFKITNGSGTWFTHPDFDCYTGGGILCLYSDPIIINNCITKNTSGQIFPYDGGCGGGIGCYWSNPEIKFNDICVNEVTWTGGGIDCWESSPIIEINKICYNTADDGGGISCDSSSDAFIISNLIKGNTAINDSGGGIGAWESNPIIVNNHVIYNKALQGSDDPGNGGGIDCYDTNAIIINNLVYNNSSDAYGGGIRCESNKYDPYIANNIIWENKAPHGPEIFILTGNPVIEYSDIKGGWPGTGNINIYPSFKDPSNEDYDLKRSSACIDAGINNVPFLPKTDYEGDPRIFSGNGKGLPVVYPPLKALIDIGPDEYCLWNKTNFIIK